MVWEKCDINSPVLAYTIRTEGGFSGEQWWGSEYFSNDSFGYDGIEEGSGITLGKWIKASFPLYEKDAEGELLPSLLDNGNQKWTDGCITMEKVDITDRIQYKEGQVLGVNTEASASSDLASTNTATGSASTNLVQSDEESTDSAKIQELLKGISGADASSSGDLGWVELEASQSAATPEMMIMEWKKEPTREAMVSSGMLRILGLDLNSAIGKAFKVSFVIVKSLMPSIEGKLSSSETEYKIVGVFEDDTNSYFYIPFSDIRTLGVSNYSQLKLISKNESDTVDIRKKIETMGFQTTSTADTAVEIEKIFGTVRLLLASLGLIALAVAALGMFNTLTVSLLERTREVGVMKAIGMKSEEVKNLFLAEAMIIGISGGVIGLSFGMLFGKLLSLIISIFSIIQKEGFLNLTYTPFFLPHLFLFFPLLSGW